MALSAKKTLIINVVLLLGVAAALFQGYLPLTDEILTLNQELHTFEAQLKTLKMQYGVKVVDKVLERKVYAMPESESEHLSTQLETLAAKHQMKLIHIEPDKGQTETISRLELKMVPYTMAFSGKDLQAFTQLLSDLENNFPEIALQTLSYEKEVGTLDVLLLTSTQKVRLFSP